MNNCTVTNFYLEDWNSDAILLRHLLKHWSTSHILYLVFRRSSLEIRTGTESHKKSSRLTRRGGGCGNGSGDAQADG